MISLFNKYRRFKLYDEERNPVLITRYAAIRENGDGKLELITWEPQIVKEINLMAFKKSVAFAHDFLSKIYYKINIFTAHLQIEELLQHIRCLGLSYKSSPFIQGFCIPIIKDGIKFIYADNLHEIIGYNLKEKRNGLAIEFSNRNDSDKIVDNVPGKEKSFNEPTAKICFHVPKDLLNKFRQVTIEKWTRFNVLAAEAIEIYVSEKEATRTKVVSNKHKNKKFSS